MTILWENDTVAGCATLCESTDAPKPRKARLVLAGKLPFATRVADHFRRQGWHVHVLEADEDLYRIVRTQRASAVVIDVQMGSESGFLVCAKLLRNQPRMPVLIVGSRRRTSDAKFAEFVGAAGFVCGDDQPHQVLGAVGGVLRLAS